jgi:Na+-driven multidrug efflux pump
LARVAVAFTLPQLIGFKGICLAGPIAWFAAAIPLAISYYRVIYSKEYKEVENGNKSVQ